MNVFYVMNELLILHLTGELFNLVDPVSVWVHFKLTLQIWCWVVV